MYAILYIPLVLGRNHYTNKSNTWLLQCPTNCNIIWPLCAFYCLKTSVFLLLCKFEYFIAALQLIVLFTVAIETCHRGRLHRVSTESDQSLRDPWAYEEETSHPLTLPDANLFSSSRQPHIPFIPLHTHLPISSARLATLTPSVSGKSSKVLCTFTW